MYIFNAKGEIEWQPDTSDKSPNQAYYPANQAQYLTQEIIDAIQASQQACQTTAKKIQDQAVYIEPNVKMIDPYTNKWVTMPDPQWASSQEISWGAPSSFIPKKKLEQGPLKMNPHFSRPLPLP